MKTPVTKKIMIGLGAALSLIGDGPAHYMMTSTHEEEILCATTEVFTYERDAIITPVDIGIIGAVLLVLGAMAKD